jgi:hypothetical protein
MPGCHCLSSDTSSLLQRHGAQSSNPSHFCSWEVATDKCSPCGLSSEDILPREIPSLRLSQVSNNRKQPVNPPHRVPWKGHVSSEAPSWTHTHLGFYDGALQGAVVLVIEKTELQGTQGG